MDKDKVKPEPAQGFSRRSFLAGAVVGGAVAAAGAVLPRKLFTDPEKPPWISEYYVNGFWLDSAGISALAANPPLLETKTLADLAIIGGGFTGLASAWHLAEKFPQKKIVVLEAAQCGYGASGRNGGEVIAAHELIKDICEKEGAEAAKKFYDVSKQGLELIQSLVQDHGIACDLETTGVLVAAAREADLKYLEAEHAAAKAIGRESGLLGRDEVRKELKTERWFGGWRTGDGAIINPAKLALGMKKLVESLGVQIFERTKVIRLRPGKKIRLETEFGEVLADAAVIATNGYSHALGQFKNRIIPLGNYVIATEPLSPKQMEEIGWKGRMSVWDTRTEFDYTRLTADNRIVMGGEGAPYYYGGGFSSGNYKPSLAMLEQSLLKTWPQLQGIKITHRWGGTMAFTLDFIPSFGVMKDYKNIFYGVGYSGEGVAMAQLAGKVIGELYAGESSELTKFAWVNREMPWLPPEPLRAVGIGLFKKFF